jgi:hypothetical protein
LGAHTLYTAASEYAAHRVRWPRAVPAVAIGCVVLLACGLLYSTRATAVFWRQFQANEEGVRRAAGEWIAANSAATATVASEAIGYIGWYSRRPVVDLAGLVSPSVVQVRVRSRTGAEFYSGVFRELHPDFVVLRSFEVDENRARVGGPMFESPDERSLFEASYVEVKRFTAPHAEIWGGSAGASFTIFERRVNRWETQPRERR